MATAGHMADQMSGDRVLKYYTVTLGNTLGHDPGIVKKLHELIPGLNNVLNSEECDFILVFLHFDLQAGTDIKEAVKMLNTLSGDKPAILMVLHHMFDLNDTVPDSRGAVNRKNMITVDLLYCKDTGLLTCSENDQALTKVINWIKPEVGNSFEDISNIGPRQSQTHEQLLKNPHSKYFTLVTGNTLGHHISIERKLQELIPGLQKVQDLEECDFILVFCPVVSCAETDIEAAVNMLNTLPGNRPTVLVVLHHTFNPEYVAPESSRRVNRENTVTVDCLFYEDKGLLHCFKNDEALSKVINWLQFEGILKNPNQDSDNQMLMRPYKKYFTFVTGNTTACNVGVERKFEELIKGLQEVQTLEECDFILVFCHFDSQWGTDIEPALNKLSSLPDNKAAVVLVLHYTSDPNTIVPDSSGAVNRKNTITVDLLFCKDMGLLTCYKNDEALSKVINCINPEVRNSFEDISNIGPRQSQNQDTTAKQMLMHRHIKFSTLVIGNTFAHDVGLERKFEELIEGLQKVQTLEECDFILVFCLFDSQCGTDIEPSLNMLSSLPGDKAAVVLVLHHTYDPNTIVPDSSGAVNRRNTITVDLLFCKDKGLVERSENDEALSKVINWINLVGIPNMGPRQSQTDEHITNQLLKNPHPKHFTLVTGNTLGHHVSIERKLQELITGLQEVQDLKECDFILVFCPVVSQAENDIEAAVKKVNTLPGNRPTVLVVLHHTFDPEYVAPESSRHVNRENTVTVDCLFYEDQGLLHCYKNDEALSKVINWLQSEGILTKPAKQTQSMNADEVWSKIKNIFTLGGNSYKQPNKHPIVQDRTAIHPLRHFSLKIGNTLGHDVGIEKNIQELIPGLQKVQKLEECDFILVFCPIVSRAGTDIAAAMKELNILSGTKPAALMALHHTFNPEEIVPDTKMTVKRDHLIAVDCLFHEDYGLLPCNKNNEAYFLVSDWINTQVLPKTKKGNIFNKKGNMAIDESSGGHDLAGPAARRRRTSDSSQDLTN